MSVKPEGVTLYDQSFEHVLLFLHPFPEAEYTQLVNYWLQPVQRTVVVRGSLRSGLNREQRVTAASRLEQWAQNDKSREVTGSGTGELFKRCARLVKEHQRKAVLVNLRLLNEYLASPSVSLPWVPPRLLSTNLTGEPDVVDLTHEDEDDGDQLSVTRAVINVDSFCAYFSKARTEEEALVKQKTNPDANPPTLEKAELPVDMKSEEKGKEVGVKLEDKEGGGRKRKRGDSRAKKLASARVQSGARGLASPHMWAYEKCCARRGYK